MRIGVFGGMFDPPHVGHLMIMDQVSEALDLDVVMMVPCANPPHRGSAISSFERRFTMCRLATETPSAPVGARILVSDVEGAIDGYGYSWKMIDRVKHGLEEGGVTPDLFLILGEDEYSSFPDWANPQFIAGTCNIVCAPRRGCELTVWGGRHRRPMKRERVSFVEVDGPDGISSSLIRDRLEAGRSVRHLVHPRVLDYIVMNDLYGWEMPLGEG